MTEKEYRSAVRNLAVSVSMVLFASLLPYGAEAGFPDQSSPRDNISKNHELALPEALKKIGSLFDNSVTQSKPLPSISAVKPIAAQNIGFILDQPPEAGKLSVQKTSLPPVTEAFFVSPVKAVPKPIVAENQTGGLHYSRIFAAPAYDKAIADLPLAPEASVSTQPVAVLALRVPAPEPLNPPVQQPAILPPRTRITTELLATTMGDVAPVPDVQVNDTKPAVSSDNKLPLPLPSKPELSPAAPITTTPLPVIAATPVLPKPSVPSKLDLPVLQTTPAQPSSSPLPFISSVVPQPAPATAVPDTKSKLQLKPDAVSPASKQIAEKIPPQKLPVPKADAPIVVEHEGKNALEGDELKKHTGVGLEMTLKKPRINVDRALEEAYDYLMAGNQEEAVRLYKEVLAIKPNQKLALFGLATTYHRAGQLQLARPLYGKLLSIDPNNVEGLNNFLVLISDESPRDALHELQSLQRTHPKFSPIPAQIAIIHSKLGEYPQAVASMQTAIGLSPENLKYRYDIAVMYDEMGDSENAIPFYQQLIAASDRGEKIPANAEEIQQRLTFLMSNVHSGK